MYVFYFDRMAWLAADDDMLIHTVLAAADEECIAHDGFMIT